MEGMTMNLQVAILDPDSFRPVIERFNARDNELYIQSVPNCDAWDFLRQNIPLFDCPDEDLKEIYLFRWWVFRKHVRRTPDGFVITEFHPDVPWAGKHNAISCPAGHHFREGRWLANRTFLEDYARYWLRGGGSPRAYSFWIADSLLVFHKAQPNLDMLADLLPDLAANWEAWVKSHGQPDGLFYQHDDRDGMEIGIGGSGKRPTINSYMFGDAVAIAEIAQLVGDLSLAREYSRKAEVLRQRVLEKLWNPAANFFMTVGAHNLAPNPQRTVAPKAPDGQFVNVRELIGYVPWYFHLPPEGQGYDVAWEQLMDPQGFYAPFGPTTAEQRHPDFRVIYEGHACQWNGPSWPFATTQTLVALANLLHDYQQDTVTAADYRKVLDCYVRSHRYRQLPPAEWTEPGAGQPQTTSLVREETDQPWIDENLNPFNGDWIARTMLRHQSWKPGQEERGKDYNHSAFCDLVITGLIGLRPRLDDIVEVHPLVSPDWDWFCLDRVPYHGHMLTIVWDRNGTKYGKGAGLSVFADGRLLANTSSLSRIHAELPQITVDANKG